MTKSQKETFERRGLLVTHLAIEAAELDNEMDFEASQHIWDAMTLLASKYAAQEAINSKKRVSHKRAKVLFAKMKAAVEAAGK